jgi:hypothetical protein
MMYARLSESLTKLAARALKSSRFVALAMVATFTSVAMQPAQAQTADTWKSVAIIGGSTAVGAYVGHKVAGPTGALVGAGVGASAGYAIDRRRRANQYYNQTAYDGGYYGDNGGYYGNNNGGYYGNNGGYGNDGYYGPSDGGYQYPAGYLSNNYSSNSNRYYSRRR